MPLYCGDKVQLPVGYDGFDTRYNCLKKGIGVGKNIVRRDLNGGTRVAPPVACTCPPAGPRKTPWYMYVLLALLVVIVILLLVFLIVSTE